MSLPSMQCDEVRLLMRAYLDERIDEARELAVQEHLDDCDACGALLIGRVDRAVTGDEMELPRRLLDAASGRPGRSRRRAPVDGSRSRARTLPAVAAVAAGVLVAALFFTTSEVAGEERVLAELRRGPEGVQNAVYRVVGDPASPARELVFEGTKLRLLTERRGEELVSAAGLDGAWSWSFDATADRLRLSQDDAVMATPGLAAPVLPGGAPLADFLSHNFELSYDGEFDVDGHRCWVLVARPDDEEMDRRIRCYVDVGRRLVRKWTEEGGGDAGKTIVLKKLNVGEASLAFGPDAFVSVDTKLEVISDDLSLSGVTVKVALDELASHLGEPAFEGFVTVDAKVLSGGAHELLPMLTRLKDVSLGAAVVQVKRMRNDLLVDLPPELRGEVSPEALARARDLETLLDEIEAATGLEIVFVSDRPIKKVMLRMRSNVAMPAGMLLNSVATMHGLSLRMDGGKVILSDREDG